MVVLFVLGCIAADLVVVLLDCVWLVIADLIGCPLVVFLLWVVRFVCFKSCGLILSWFNPLSGILAVCLFVVILRLYCCFELLVVLYLLFLCFGFCCFLDYFVVLLGFGCLGLVGLVYCLLLWVYYLYFLLYCALRFGVV